MRYNPRADCLLYPRTYPSGQTAGYKVRHLDTGKVYNYPSGISMNEIMPWFVTSESPDEVYICEGETDALRLATEMDGYQIKSTIMCCPGATAFPNVWAGYLANYNRVVIIPDADSAGELMAKKISSLVPRAVVVQLPPGMDLSEYLNEYLFYEDFLPLVAEARPMPTHKMPLRKSQYQSNLNIDPSRMVDEVVKDVRLKRRGKEFVGCCPFHKEDTPSFMVDPKKGLYYCHGCQRGGDLVKYLQDKRGLDWKEAFRIARGER